MPNNSDESSTFTVCYKLAISDNLTYVRFFDLYIYFLSLLILYLHNNLAYLIWPFQAATEQKIRMVFCTDIYFEMDSDKGYFHLRRITGKK